MKKNPIPAVPPADVLHNSQLFSKEVTKASVMSFARDLCSVLKTKNRVTLHHDSDETILTILTGEVLVDIRMSERRVQL
ncbi:hypothetical protein D0T49_03910 [Paludibacter sp. 221]|uniref:hypothetical protein n=1 Tax=Paludibacter sp. 221 TaxID=2302939 RepID=UPI0013D7B404|nr:hypothetical protein [Paludibacter sp. 221]NDV46186.1 hypothetical protein [Paludibacter sp. 221]